MGGWGRRGGEARVSDFFLLESKFKKILGRGAGGGGGGWGGLE